MVHFDYDRISHEDLCHHGLASRHWLPGVNEGMCPRTPLGSVFAGSLHWWHRPQEPFSSPRDQGVSPSSHPSRRLQLGAVPVPLFAELATAPGDVAYLFGWWLLLVLTIFKRF